MIKNDKPHINKTSVCVSEQERERERERIEREKMLHKGYENRHKFHL